MCVQGTEILYKDIELDHFAFDVGCQLVKRLDTLQLERGLASVRVVVPSFHILVHKPPCAANNSLQFKLGAGTGRGESTEMINSHISEYF